MLSNSVMKICAMFMSCYIVLAHMALHLYLGSMQKIVKPLHDETRGKDTRGSFSSFVPSVDLILLIVTLTRT